MCLGAGSLHRIGPGAESFYHGSGCAGVGVAGEVAVGTFQDAGGRPVSVEGQPGGDDSRVGGPSRVEMLGPRAVGQEGHRSGRHAACDAEGGSHLAAIATQEEAGSRRGSEGTDRTGGMEAASVLGSGPDRLTDAGHHLVADYGRPHEVLPSHLSGQRQGEERREHDRPRVGGRRLVGVIALQDVGGGSVYQAAHLGHRRRSGRQR